MHRSPLVRLALAVLLFTGVSACATGGAARTSFLPPSRPAEFSLGALPWGASVDSVIARRSGPLRGTRSPARHWDHSREG